MGKQVKSQWDFGELFPVEQTRRVLSVSQLSQQIKGLLEKQIGQVWVTGEITNLRAQSSGHIYFTLKDASAQLNCVLFRGEAMAQREFVQDGQKVLLQGDLTVYEPRGQYQLLVIAVELQGIGTLQQAFERLKQKLKTEGLFAAERKRLLPRCPQRIGLVTSPTGAAIRDVLHVIQRRNPALEIFLVPCRVQGQGAAEEIAAAIRLLNEFIIRSNQPEESHFKGEIRNPNSKIDLILVTRGGGSLEDLWAFNEEVVARAVFESALPVVSAVGHEIDFTICDFVADVRAATPSAAAEIITEGVFASRQFITESFDWMRQRFRQRLAREQEACQQLTQRLMRAHPRRRLNERWQRLDDLQTSLTRCMKYRLRDQQIAWQNLRQRLARLRPGLALAQRRELLDQTQRRLHKLACHHWQTWQHRLATVETRLRLLSPEQVLSRGYSITTDAASGKVIRAASHVQGGQLLKTRLHSGQIRSVVED